MASFMALKHFSSTGLQVKTLDLITFLKGATNLLYCGMYELLYENWQTLINNSARLLGVLTFARRLRRSTGMLLNPNVLSSIPRKLTEGDKIEHFFLLTRKPLAPRVSIRVNFVEWIISLNG